MNAIYSGAATLLAGAATFSLLRFRASDTTIETFLRGTRPLSKSGRADLDKVNSSGDPNGGVDDVCLSIGDMVAIFSNSRLYVRVANRARLFDPQDTELAVMFEIMQEDHAKVRWQILLSAIESIVGRLGLGRITHYARMLLWTYGEELELLDRISQKFGPLEGDAIRAIL